MILHPGNYFPTTNPLQDEAAAFVLGDKQTGLLPKLIRALDPANPPVLYSCDPSADLGCWGAALLVANSSAVIVDGLQIYGRLEVLNSQRVVLQNLSCTQGWGHCGQGDWSCIHIESSEACLLHHNCISNMSGADRCEGCSDSQGCDTTVALLDDGTGIRVQNSNNVLVEFNTVQAAPAFGIDVAGGQGVVPVRFNHVADAGKVGIRFRGCDSLDVYGNLLPASSGVFASCVQVLNDPQGIIANGPARILHNTCMGYSQGLYLESENQFQVEGNVIGALWNGLPGANLFWTNHYAGNHNAFDVDGSFLQQQTPQGPVLLLDTLEEFQVATGEDFDSMECEGTCCQFELWPPVNGAYDLHMNGGPCFFDTVNGDSREMGAYGLGVEPGGDCPN